MLPVGDRFYYATRCGTDGELWSVKKDGTDKVSQLKLEDMTASFVLGSDVIVNTSSCMTGGIYDTCYKIFKPSDKSVTALFPDLIDTDITAVVGDQAFYFDDESDEYLQRAIPSGQPKVVFKNDKAAVFVNNGTWVTFERPADSSFEQEHVLHKLDGSSTISLFQGSDAATDFFFQGDYLYWVRRTGNGSGSLQRLKLGTTSGETLFNTPVLPIRTKVSGDKLYFQGFGDAQDRLYRMPLAGGPITPVATFKRSDLVNYLVTADGLFAVLFTGPRAFLVHIKEP